MQRKAHPNDMNRHDILAAIRKRGSNLRQLSLAYGYSADALRNALVRPWPKAEALIAEFLGLTPQAIWPSRYHADGSPKSGRGERGFGRNRTNMESNRDGTRCRPDGSREDGEDPTPNSRRHRRA
ncbi:MAG TPA: helix-turn-helix transcriptional regulator [Rhodocyclaceae bacterium]|nr:helix-turn-helix transcriptional regulator [Rhodocyclaceae bacterium]